MAIKSIGNVSCGLNLGLIYSLSYSYTPKEGVNITVYFVTESGEYTEPSLLPLRKTFISIGPANFSVYPVASSIEKSAGRRIAKVEFIDEMFMLDHYYVVLKGRGCGKNVYQLGSPVDNRSFAEQVDTSIDPVAQQIKNFTQFPDIQYSFNDFLNVLRLKFNVQILASINNNIRYDFTGSFRDVLDAWCQAYNLGFFFENGSIKIFNPTTLNITLPSQPLEAIEYNVSQDIRSTYGKTVCNWYQQDGGEFSLSQTSNNKGPLYTRTNTLFPVGHEFNLNQTTVDLNQVVAAMYGQHFWFLYNYNQGTTATECGWTPIEQSSINGSFSVISSVNQLNGRIAIFDQNIFDQKFAMYQRYGQEIAGRWYLSSEENEIATDQSFTWFNEIAGQIFDFNYVDDKSVKLDYLTPTNSDVNIITETVINQYFPGVNYIGNRVAYKDDYKVDWATEFSFVSRNVAQLVESTFATFFSINGHESIDFSQLNAAYPNNNFLAYIPSSVPEDITNIFDGFADKQIFFKPRFDNVPIVGISSADYTSLKAAQSEPQSVQIVNSAQGPTVVANTSVIKTLQQGNYSVYYDKYAQCASASSSDDYFGYKFEQHQVSSDNQIEVTFTKQAGNTYQLFRNYAYILSLINNAYLSLLAQPKSWPTKEVTFSLNYFYDVPQNFISNGLTSMDISIGDNGITASYTFSNSILQPRDYEILFAQYEQRIRNSWIRSYRPDEVIK